MRSSQGSEQSRLQQAAAGIRILESLLQLSGSFALRSVGAQSGRLAVPGQAAAVFISKRRCPSRLALIDRVFVIVVCFSFIVAACL